MPFYNLSVFNSGSFDVFFRLGVTVVIAITMVGIIHSTFNWLARRYPKWWVSQLVQSLKTVIYGAVLTTTLIEIISIFSQLFSSVISITHLETGKTLIFFLTLTLVTLKIKHHLVNHLSSKITLRDDSDRTIVFVTDRILTLVIGTIGTLVTLDSLGISINTLLAFGGIGGLAISWASKDVIANFFGGLMIFLNRPFSAGDWIASPNKNFEGVVEHIGWYRTQIRTFERRPAYIPNSIITDAIVQNPGRMYNRRIKETIGLRYSDVGLIKSVIEDITKMLKEHPGIDQQQIIMVHFLSFGASSLDIFIYCFTQTCNWKASRDVQQDILFKIVAIVHGHNADFAFPTQTLHSPDPIKLAQTE